MTVSECSSGTNSAIWLVPSLPLLLAAKPLRFVSKLCFLALLCFFASVLTVDGVGSAMVSESNLRGEFDASE